MKKTRTEEYVQTLYRQIDQVACDNCGTVIDSPTSTFPPGWFSLSTTDGERFRSWHFDHWDCLMGFVTAHEEPPSKLLEQLTASVEAERAKREGVTA
jgi:hypothetical protein